MVENYFSKTPKFNPAAFKQGVNLGMFSPSSQEPKSSFGNVQNILSQMTAAGIDVKNVSPEKIFEYSFLNNLLSSVNPEQQFDFTERSLKSQEERDLRIAKERQKLGKESNELGLLYNAIANIGSNISQAINPGSLRGAGAEIARTANESFRSVPSMNIQGPGYSVSQFKYFS